MLGETQYRIITFSVSSTFWRLNVFGKAFSKGKPIIYTSGRGRAKRKDNVPISLLLALELIPAAGFSSRITLESFPFNLV